MTSRCYGGRQQLSGGHLGVLETSIFGKEDYAERDKFLSNTVSDIFGSSYHADICPSVYFSDNFAGTLAPNNVKITIWRRPYLGYFGFTSVQWEEAEAGRPSLCTFYV